MLYASTVKKYTCIYHMQVSLYPFQHKLREKNDEKGDYDDDKDDDDDDVDDDDDE